MNENTIVSLADSKYFDLLNELIESIKSFEQSKDVDICILDAGLKENQLELLSKKVDIIEKAKWDIEVPSYKVYSGVSTVFFWKPTIRSTSAFHKIYFMVFYPYSLYCFDGFG